MHAQDAHSTSAYDAAALLHIIAGTTRTPRTCQLAPRSPLPSHHTITRTQTHRMRQAPPTTTPRQRHGTCHPKQRTPTSHWHAPHIAHSRTAYKHTSPARPHDVLHSHNHCELCKHHFTHTAARTPHTARHTASRTPHTAHRKSHPVTHAASAPHSQ